MLATATYRGYGATCPFCNTINFVSDGSDKTIRNNTCIHYLNTVSGGSYIVDMVFQLGKSQK